MNVYVAIRLFRYCEILKMADLDKIIHVASTVTFIKIIVKQKRDLIGGDTCEQESCAIMM